MTQPVMIVRFESIRRSLFVSDWDGLQPVAVVTLNKGQLMFVTGADRVRLCGYAKLLPLNSADYM